MMYESDVHWGITMHRTQIYFEESMFEELKQQANSMGLSLSAYIRQTLKADLKEKNKEHKTPDFSDFDGLWKDKDKARHHFAKKPGNHNSGG